MWTPPSDGRPARALRGALALALLGALIAPATPLAARSAKRTRPQGPREFGCPILPADNPLNEAIANAPVDPSSTRYLESIGPSAHLHPDFGRNPAYGIPYAVVSRAQPKVPIRFTEYAEESEPG